MVQAFFHVGLHKTGTSSFQEALSAAREALYRQGILYPEAPPGASFPEQHADIALMLMRGQEGPASDYFDAVAAQLDAVAGRGLRYVLFSSEEFSNLCFNAAAFAALRRIAFRRFRGAKCVLVLRNPMELLSSELRQNLDSGEMSVRDLESDETILNAFLGLAHKVKVLSTQLGPPLVIDYEEARTSGDLNNFFAGKCFGDAAPVLRNLHTNIGTERDARMDFLLSQLRRLVATLKGANPYSQAVEAELDRLVDRGKLREAVRPHEAAAFAVLLETEVRRIVERGYRRHRSEILDAMSAIPEAYRWLLTRALP